MTDLSFFGLHEGSVLYSPAVYAECLAMLKNVAIVAFVCGAVLPFIPRIRT
jgi:hypothetical protein